MSDSVGSMRGWASYLFDDEYFQRRDINQLRTDEDALEIGVDALAGEVARLRRIVHELSVTSAVALKMLADAGQLDLRALQARVMAELQAPAASGAAAHDQACIRCRRRYPLNKLDLTEDGPVCDFCR